MNSQPTEPRRYPRSFQVVAKPLGPVCNLDCTYCYYRHKEEWLPGTNARIADDLLEEFIRQYIAGQEEEPVVFNWHGGEPTLLGLDFFRKVVQLEQKYADGKRIENDFQTNGVLLDESWCEFLKQSRFYVGLSLDGPKPLHDAFRKTRQGEPSFDRVYRAARLLQQYEVPFNPLTVVNAVYSAQQRRFGMNEHESLPDCCKQCQYIFACNGECAKNRFLKSADGQAGLTAR
jgi:uncharacterized protein